MSEEEYYPYNTYLEREPASNDDLKAMEGIATDLLVPIPGEIVSQYAVISQDDELLLACDSVLKDNAETDKASITVHLISPKYDLPRFSVSFDHENQLIPIIGSSNEYLNEAAHLARQLLAADQLDRRVASIVRCLEAAIFHQFTGIEESGPPMVYSPDSDETPEHFADAVRSLISQKTRVKERLKRFESELDKTHKVTINENEVFGLPEEDIKTVPRLRIRCDDLVTATTYRYFRTNGGQAFLYKHNTQENLSDHIAAHAPHSPLKSHVNTLIDKLAAAAIQSDISPSSP